VHIALVLLLWRSDTADIVRAAIDPLPANRTTGYRDTLAFHLRGDAALPEGGWRLFGDSLIRGFPAAGLRVPAANYGIGRDDATGLAERLPLYDSIGRAEGVLLAVGVNDIERSTVSRIVTRYGALVDALPPATTLICHGVLPIDERVLDIDPAGRSNARIDALNAALRTLCTDRGQRYVQPPAALADADGNLRAELHVGDGVHLDADGYAVWLDSLNDVLAQPAPAAATAPEPP